MHLTLLVHSGDRLGQFLTPSLSPSQEKELGKEKKQPTSILQQTDLLAPLSKGASTVNTVLVWITSTGSYKTTAGDASSVQMGRVEFICNPSLNSRNLRLIKS